MKKLCALNIIFNEYRYSISIDLQVIELKLEDNNFDV